MRMSSFVPFVAVLSLAGVLSVGCATFDADPSSFSLFGDGKAEAAERERLAALPKYTVEVRRQGYEPVRKDVPLEEVTFVSKALKDSRAQSSMGRMKITLFRSEPGQLQPVRFPVDYSASKKMVGINTDYQVRPGDKLLIVEDPSTPLDDMIDSIVPSGGEMPSVWGT